MQRLTRPGTALTTRKHFLRAAPALALSALLLFTAGCSTPGPTHTYTAGLAESPIIDSLPGAPDVEVPTYLAAINELYGIAYDPFTDHLFLRVFPGDFVRVIDRPARKIKRSFIVKNLPPGRGDLAIRSADRHLFFAHPTEPSVIETTLRGVIVRTITLANAHGAFAGVAYDQKNNQLLVLQGGDLAHVGTYDLNGQRVSGVSLDRNVRLTSLAYDSDAAEFYAPLADEPAIGIFNREGRFLRSMPAADGTARDFVDVGQRSLLRLF